MDLLPDITEDKLFFAIRKPNYMHNTSKTDEFTTEKKSQCPGLLFSQRVTTYEQRHSFIIAQGL